MDLTNKFSLQPVNAVSLTPLSEIEIMELLNETVSKDGEETFGDFSLSFGAEGRIALNLFNDADDDNNDEPAKELYLDKHIAENFAFLSYELYGKLSGGVKGDVDYLKLGLSLENEISHKSYLKHENSTRLADAVARDISRFKVLFDFASVRNLGDHEALVLSSKSAMEINGELSVSDTFTPLLSGISKFLNAADTISMKMEMSASIKVNVNISDNFRILIQRRNANTERPYYISLNKDRKKSTEGTVALGVTASIGNPEVLMDAINRIIERGEQGLSAQLETLRNKAWNALSSEDKARVEQGARLIGLKEDEVKEGLLQKYFAKKDELVENVKEIITSEAKFAVSHTYQRVKETQSLLKGTFSESAVKDCLSDIVRVQINKIYDYSKKEAGNVRVEEYLDLTKIRYTRSTKVGLTISKFELSQLVSKEEEITNEVRYDESSKEETQKVTFSATKLTVEKFGVYSERTNKIVLSGSYGGKTLDKVGMGNLAYDFRLQYNDNYRTVKKHHIRNIVDFAITWGLLKESEFDNRVATLSELLEQKEKVQLKVLLELKGGMFSSILDGLIQLSDHELHGLLAAAVPYAPYGGRTSPTERKALYYSLFSWLKQNERKRAGITGDDVQNVLIGHFQANNRAELVTFELSGDPGYTQMSRAYDYNSPVFTYKTFITALQKLQDKTALLEPTVKSRDFQNALYLIRLQPEFNMRFLGRLISEQSVKSGVQDKLEISMTIEYANGDQTEKYVIAK